MEDSDKSKIDNLKQILYSRKVKIKPNFVLDLHAHRPDIKEGWQKNEATENPLELAGTEEKDDSGLFKKIFLYSLGFFIISALVAGYAYLNGGNVISANNIKIDVIGPTSIKAGEETVLDISVTNNNDTALKIVDLVLEYPKGTRSAEDKITPMTHARIAFDDIGPRETVRRTIKALMYGEENTIAKIDMTLEYRVATAMSVFTKETSYEVAVGSSPLTLSVSGLNEVNANQNYEVKVLVMSNSSETVRDVIIVGELPFGFEPTSITPQTLPKTSVWSLGDIEPNGKREIIIKGKMYGDHNEERYFKFNLGTKDDKNIAQIDGVIANVIKPVVIRQPFIGIGLSFERLEKDNENYVAKSDSSVVGVIDVLNNLEVPVSDVSIEAKVLGVIVSRSSLKPVQGFYDSNAELLRWNKFYDVDLSSLEPGGRDSFNFTFNTFKSSDERMKKLVNPELSVDITVRGKRRLESGVPEEILSTMRKTVKIESDTHFSGQATHTTGPIENQGSIPPKVGNKTEYTITWAVTNTFNELEDGKVRAILPDYIEWTGIVVGQGENLTYNKVSREIIWDLGNITTQKGGQLAFRQVAFQVALTPSLGQFKTAPVILGVANFTARDTFTGTIVGDMSENLTTVLPTDPAFEYADAQVIQ